MSSKLPAVLLSALVLTASAQSRLPPGVDGGRAPEGMATRSVSQYLGLERSLADAMQGRRVDAVQQMLAPDFEVRSAESLDATGAADWLAAQARAPAAELRARDLAVREFGDVAVVSFFLDSIQRGKAPATMYVVDVWRQAEHKIAVRYVSRPVHALPAPGRPRGRE